MNDNDIKEALKKHLKMKVWLEDSGCGLNDIFVIKVLWDNETILTTTLS